MATTDRAGDGRTVDTNGVSLWVETFGDPADPAILLINGVASSVVDWDDRFCARLAAAGHLVVRYDSRDIGRSTRFPSGEPSYGLDDLVGDAVGLIDAVAGRHAHIIGVSQGGKVGQVLAINYPDRVRTLTLIATSPGTPPAGAAETDLPPPTPELMARLGRLPELSDWHDRDAVIAYLVESLRPFEGTRHPFNDAAARELATRTFDHSTDVSTHDNSANLRDGPSYRDRLGEIAVSTLVIHGTSDPLFPIAHAEILAREIPHARLLPIDGMGHQYLPPWSWDEVVPDILQLTSGRAGAR